MAHYHYLAKKLAIYHCFGNMKKSTTFLKLKLVKLEFAVKLEFPNLEFFEKIYSENFWKFFIVLEYHGKLNFAKFEYPKTGSYIFSK